MQQSGPKQKRTSLHATAMVKNPPHQDLTHRHQARERQHHRPLQRNGYRLHTTALGKYESARKQRHGSENGTHGPGTKNTRMNGSKTGQVRHGRHGGKRLNTVADGGPRHQMGRIGHTTQRTAGGEPLRNTGNNTTKDQGGKASTWGMSLACVTQQPPIGE